MSNPHEPARHRRHAATMATDNGNVKAVTRPSEIYAPARPKYVPRKGRWDEVKLWQLGYKQELRRTLNLATNACCAVGIMSIWASSEAYATQGLAYGGPVVVIWGWVLVSCFSMAIALCMAELVSAFPTSGGLYYWSYMLAPVRYRRLACWMTGWINMLGQVATTAALELMITNFVASLVQLHTLGPGEQPGYEMTPLQRLGVLAALLAVHAAINSIGPRTTRILLIFSGWWHVVATPAFCAMLLWVAPKHQSPAFVFTKWVPGSEASGITSPPYIFMMGLLMSQWSILGYDACVHLAEEVVDAGSSASWSLVASVGFTCCVGLLTLLSLTFSLQSLDNLFDEASVATGMAQLTWDVFKARYGYGHGSIPALYVFLVAMFTASTMYFTANGRVVYAFSRDGAMLGSRWWRQLSPRTQQPVAGVWLMAALSFLIGSPAVFVRQYLNALSATCVIALTLSCAIPIALGLWRGPEGYVHGVFHLGRWSRPLAAASCVWVALICTVFCLPMVYPVTALNTNWAPLMLGLLLVFALALWWAPGFGGCHWFRGPIPNINNFIPDEPPPPGTSSHPTAGSTAPTLHPPPPSLPRTSLPHHPDTCRSSQAVAVHRYHGGVGAAPPSLVPGSLAGRDQPQQPLASPATSPSHSCPLPLQPIQATASVEPNLETHTHSISGLPGHPPPSQQKQSSVAVSQQLSLGWQVLGEFVSGEQPGRAASSKAMDPHRPLCGPVAGQAAGAHNTALEIQAAPYRPKPAGTPAAADGAAPAPAPAPAAPAAPVAAATAPHPLPWAPHTGWAHSSAAPGREAAAAAAAAAAGGQPVSPGSAHNSEGASSGPGSLSASPSPPQPPHWAAPRVSLIRQLTGKILGGSNRSSHDSSGRLQDFSHLPVPPAAAASAGGWGPRAMPQGLTRATQLHPERGSSPMCSPLPSAHHPPHGTRRAHRPLVSTSARYLMERARTAATYAATASPSVSPSTQLQRCSEANPKCPSPTPSYLAALTHTSSTQAPAPGPSGKGEEAHDDQYSVLLSLMADPLGTHTCLASSPPPQQQPGRCSGSGYGEGGVAHLAAHSATTSQPGSEHWAWPAF